MHNRRINALFIGFLLVFFAVAVHLARLQLVHSDDYRSSAERQRISLVPLDVARARILASDGSVLVEDRIVYDVAVVLSVLDPNSRREIRGPMRGLFYVRQTEKLRAITGAGWYVEGDNVHAWSKLDIETKDAKGPVFHESSRKVTFNLPPRVIGSLQKLSLLTGKTYESLLAGVLDAAVDAARMRTPVHEPVAIATDVAFNTIAAIETSPEDFRGFVITRRFERATPSGPLAAHVLGNVARFSNLDVNNAMQKYSGWPGAGFFSQQRIGRNGIELMMDNELRGEFGLECIVHDNLGRRQSLVADTPPNPGHDVVTTLDLRLQTIVQEALEGEVGAAVFIDLQTGNIIAIASSPGFDPATFGQDYTALASNRDQPLFDRAARGHLPLGSVFKLATAIAMLESGRGGEKIECTGMVLEGTRIYRCHNRYGHGVLNLEEAIKVSCNCYFYEAGRRVGSDALIGAAAKLGYGRATGSKIPGEYGGNLPMRVNGGQLVNLSIGQGELLVTPLQVAQMMAIIANGGKIYQPRLLKELRPFDTDSLAVLSIGETAPPKDAGISKASFDAIKAGMYRVVNEQGGTAYKVFGDFDRGFKICGKTSTAQRRPGDNVGWFAGFAPHDNPRIGFAIAVERLSGSDGGGSTAAPVGRKIFDKIPLELLGKGGAR